MAEVKDIKPELDAKCLAEKCQKQKHDYEKCLKRIESVPVTKEPHCWGWYFEIVHCVDHCAEHDLWHSLK